MISRGLIAGLMLTMASAHGAVTCTVTTAPLNFGTYDPFAAANLDVATQATITCTTNRNSGGDFAVVTSAISKGGAPTFSPRQMRNALNNTLDYNLFTTTGRTTIFGDGTSTTATRSGFAFVTNRFTPAVIRVDVFGRVFAGQDASVGAYTDTLNYTITF
jgi:spore coat protein U-like protein